MPRGSPAGTCRGPSPWPDILTGDRLVLASRTVLTVERRARKERREPAGSRVTGRVGGGPQGAAREGEGADPRPRRAERRAPAPADGRGREGLRLRGTRRRGDPARPVRRPPPADRGPLHVRPG